MIPPLAWSLDLMSETGAKGGLSTPTAGEVELSEASAILSGVSSLSLITLGGSYRRCATSEVVDELACEVG